MEFEIWHFVIAAIALVNLIVSIFLIKLDTLNGFQKGAQVFLVWLLPIIGAAILFFFHREEWKEMRNKKAFGGGNADSVDASAGND